MDDAFARLDCNDIIRLEQECSIWRANMLTPPAMVLTPSRSLTGCQAQSPAGFELEGDVASAGGRHSARLANVHGGD